jgi:hypothetical protein
MLTRTCLRSAAEPPESGEQLPGREGEGSCRRGAAARHPLCHPTRRPRGSRWEPSPDVSFSTHEFLNRPLATRDQAARQNLDYYET